MGDGSCPEQKGGEKTPLRLAPAQTLLVAIDAEEEEKGGGEFRPRERGILQEKRVEREREGGAGGRGAQGYLPPAPGEETQRPEDERGQQYAAKLK
jgi:hypothetical protein